MLTIGKLAKNARVTTDTIRFYERVGLVKPASKTTSGYRLYTEEAVQRLNFIKQAQRCGFSLPDIRELIQPSSRDGMPSSDSYAIAMRKKAEIDQTMSALRAMSTALSAFIDSRTGNGDSALIVREDNPLVGTLARISDG